MGTALTRFTVAILSVGLLAGCGASKASQPSSSTSSTSGAAAIQTTTSTGLPAVTSVSVDSDISTVESLINGAESTAAELEKASDDS